MQGGELVFNIFHVNIAKGFRGGERQTALLIHGLERLGLKQSLLHRNGSPIIHLGSLAGLPSLRIVVNGLSIWFDVALWRDVDIIHAHDGKGAKLAWLLAMRWRKPYVITRRVMKPPRLNWLNRHIYEDAVCVICVSRAMGDVIDKQFPRAHTAVVADMKADLPVNTDRVDAIRRRFPDKFLIGYTGALVREKGVFCLIEALRILQKTNPDMHCLLIGEGADQAELQNQTKDLDNVSYEGFSDEVGTCLRAMDMFVFPSLNEGLGSSILDAMDAGLPIVASDVGGIPDLIQHGINGVLVKPDDPSAWAAAISKLAKDEGTRHALASKAKRDVNRYTVPNIASQVVGVYEKALSRPPHNPLDKP